MAEKDSKKNRQPNAEAVAGRDRACWTRSSMKAPGPRREPAGTRQGPHRRIRQPGHGRSHGRVQGHRGHDQRPDRPDRQAHFRPAQRSHAPPRLPEAGGSWRGLPYLVSQSETGETAEDQGHEHLQERPSQGHGKGQRIRPVDPVQEDLRRGVRHVRRRLLRGPDRRL